MATGSRFTLRPDDARTFPEWIRHRTRLGGDKVALEVCGVTRTYAELDDRTDRTAAGFASLGLRQGDHVSLMMQNSIENIEAWFGLQKAGIVEVPVHTASRGAALQYIVDHADAQALVVDEVFLPHVAAIVDELPQVRQVIVNRNEPGEEAVELPSRIAVHDLAELYDTGAPVPTPRVERADTAVVLHSSGTTGPPKGVVLSHDAVLHLTRHLVWLMGYGSDDRLYTAFPLFHNNAKYTTVTRRARGGRVVRARQAVPASRRSGRWPARRRSPPSTTWARSLMMLHKQPPGPDGRRQPRADRVRRAVPGRDLGGLRAALRRAAGRGVRHDRGADGLREPPRQPQDRLRRARVDDLRDADRRRERRAGAAERAGRDRAPARSVAGAIFSGYYRREADTVEAWRNLWFHTGDRGTMDEDGFLFFLDRMKDCIRRRGENISSWEVESAVNTHDGRARVGRLRRRLRAVGVGGDDRGRRCSRARRSSPSSCSTTATGEMAHFAIPRYVRFIDALPKNASERVEKFKLREEGVTGTTWDREAHGYKVRR